MKALANETFTPPNQGDNPKSYEIKALNSLEYTQVMADGSDKIKELKGLEYKDIVLLLNLGLVDKSQINTMLSEHHIYTAGAIFKKAMLAEEERKNS